MILAVASGKGGTGKTSVAASLALSWPGPVAAVDLDVEEPNLHLLLHPQPGGGQGAYLEVPSADEALCIACGACAELCQYKAISLLGETLLVFPEMCHGCGGCLAVCPSGALRPGQRELGQVLWGRAGDIAVYQGRLRVGEAMSPPLMRSVMTQVRADGAEIKGDVIIDAPPGVSCPAVTAVSQAEAILLVTEPTPFGLYDFSLAWQAFAPLGRPLAAVINRAGVGDRKVYAFCADHGIPILAEIPYDRAVAEAYSRGVPACRASSELAGLFQRLAQDCRALVGGREAAHA
ncbi:MAG: ATP-binding protein [Thermodesulfobacteriota bacterium]